MSENIIMPQLGESIAEGTIVKWLKDVGEQVAKDENILLISTDKVEAEIPSPCDGSLSEIIVGPGETVAVGTVLGKVGDASEVKSAPTKNDAAEKSGQKSNENGAPVQKREESVQPPPPQKMTPPPAFSAGERSQSQDANMASFFSPLVRRIAQEHGLNENELNNINGTGRGGRVSKRDILNYLETRSPGERSAPSSRPATQPVSAPSPLEQEIQSGDREVVKPMSTMRRVIMENMVASKATSAHVTTFFEIDFTAVDKIRAKHKERFKQEEQVSLTYTTFLAAAVCQALKRHPFINAMINKDSVTFKKDIHLGIAVALDDPEPGLMVPVIKNADKQNIRGLAHAIADLSSRVRRKKIMPNELSGGTFTITNPGNYGAIIGTPIINQPQVAILGVGQIKKQATVLEIDGTDMIAIRNMGILSLSFDHRLVDGATADKFMADLKQTIENWTHEP